MARIVSPGRLVKGQEAEEEEEEEESGPEKPHRLFFRGSIDILFLFLFCDSFFPQRSLTCFF